MEKHLRDLKWISILGSFDHTDEGSIQFVGGEYDPKLPSDALPLLEPAIVQELKFVNYGILIFNQNVSEGRLRMKVKFDQVDYRSSANIIIRHNTSTGEMLTFGIGGGGLPPPKGQGPFYGLRAWVNDVQALADNQQGGFDKSTPQKKIWINYVQGGNGANLQANYLYELEVVVRGTLLVAYIDGVEVVRHMLIDRTVLGQQVGIWCGNNVSINFQEFVIVPSVPRAFVVMQFDTPEYEALFRDVIAPICTAEGLQPFRADFTYLPGPIVADIQKQIAESRVIIAEITPANPNVYYEVGYADALGKPLILIADKREGLKPFDVRAYRTIFYENSIGGKSKVENDLRNYLRSIMSQ